MNSSVFAPKSATFSPCRSFRYTLWRGFSDLNLMQEYLPPSERRYLMVIGLNPSTADETNDDPTIRRCVSFAKAWGFEALCMTNLFAYRATDPEVMLAQADPVGPDNDRCLAECAAGAGMILAAWGKHGAHRGRDFAVKSLIKSMCCLKKNKDGSPMHPLYVAGSTQPIAFP